MAKDFSLDDYVDVAERIRDFYERFPDGRLVTGSTPSVVAIGDKSYLWYHARAYRNPDDPLPGDGYAAEPVPGTTPYTRDSELMNAETAAWGRAIVALGFATKRLASKQEVRGRAAVPMQAQTGVISKDQRKLIFTRARERGISDEALKALLYAIAQVASSALVPQSKLSDVLAAIDGQKSE